MVSLLRELTAPSGRLWIIGQSAKIAVRDAMHLLARVVMLMTSMACW